MNETERLSAGVFPLIGWYRDNARTLPWRSQPSPYRVWVSEIMLQQTRVAAVLEYYQRFIGALPDVQALADCPEQQLMKLWQGLGYYSRARNLQKAARVICREHGGEFPADYRALRSLPGVGDYTAGAIASIAFHLPEPAVDGNVLRVVTRLLADRQDITKPAEKRRIARLLAEVMPQGQAGTLNQALMELGALVCLPNGAPKCEVCPWKDLCLACQHGLTNQIPVKAPKRPRRVEKRTVFLIVHQNRIALRRRPDKGLLAGLWEFPHEMGEDLPLDAWGLTPLSLEDGGRGKHIFTHIEWHMTAVAVQVRDSILPEGWIWADERDLTDRYPIPSAFGAFLPRAGELCREVDHDL